MLPPLATVTKVEPLEKHRLRLEFDDGLKGVVDLTEVIWGPIFAPLVEEEYFMKAFLDEGIGTVAWPNGADLAPEYLRRILVTE